MSKPKCGGSTAKSASTVLADLVSQRDQFVSFVRRRVPSSAHAEDIVQAAFARTAERPEKTETAGAARAWFFRSLRNAIIDDRRRRDARERMHASFSAEARNTVSAAEREPQVCKCIDKLTAELKPQYADALRTVEVDEKTVKQLAAEAGISAGNAGVRLFRAREALRKAVKRTCGTCAEGAGCFDCSCSQEPQKHQLPTC